MPKVSAKLNSDKLRDYRKLAGLSQREVACALYGHPQPTDSNDGTEYDRKLRSITHQYQRIERDGRIVADNVPQLAKVLGTTVSDLTDQNDTAHTTPFGPFLYHLENALADWRDDPTAPSLDDVLPPRNADDIWERLYEALDGIRHGADLRGAVETLARLLEPTLLAPRPNPISTFFRHLGLAPDNLRGYFYSEGLWLVTTQGSATVEFGTLVQGLPALLNHLEDLFARTNRLPDHSSNPTAAPADTVILTHDDTLYRAELFDSVSRAHWWIDITRVEKAVSGNGLTYSSSPSVDHQLLIRELDVLCRRAAWYVRGFDDVDDETEDDIDPRLRLQMTCESPATREVTDYPLHSGDLAHQCTDFWDRGDAVTPNRRQFVVQNLVDHALESIPNHIRPGTVDLHVIDFHDPFRVSIPTRDSSFVYRISLVAEQAGYSRIMHWPDASRVPFIQALQARIAR